MSEQEFGNAISKLILRFVIDYICFYMGFLAAHRMTEHVGLGGKALTLTTDLNPADHLLRTVSGPYGTILADPPWQFQNRTGKVAPEHRRLLRYPTMKLEHIAALPVSELAAEQSHLYLWVPNALIAEGLQVMAAWGFEYKTNLVWYKIRKDGGPDGRGVGFYFRNVTELVLFGVRGNMRTLAPGRRQVNLIATRKREHSRKPDELYEIIEQCSPGPYLELFARFYRVGWHQWGNEDVEKNSLRGVAKREGHNCDRDTRSVQNEDRDMEG